MRTLFAAVAFLLLFATGAHAANEPLVLGLHPKTAALELSQLTTLSLAKDPTGHALLQPEKCKTQGACATPLIYCEQIKSRHQDSGLPKDADACLKQIARYIGGLVCRPAPKGEWYLSRLTSTGESATADHARSFHKDEFVCDDTATGKHIFATDCGNVVGKQKIVEGPPPCFAYPVDGRGYPVKIPLQTVVSFYNHDQGEDLHRLMADRCFYAEDGATHERLQLDRECTTCLPGEEQAVWPLDVVIGTETKYRFSVYSADGKIFGFPSGYGTVYVPYWFAASSLWCFTALEDYIAAAPVWDTAHSQWSYSAYFDRVSFAEVEGPMKSRARAFPRTIKPVGVLGQGR